MSSPRRRRRHFPLDTQRQHVDAWARSGLSVLRYAAQHDLSASALYAWRKRHPSPSPQDPPSTHNARLVAVAIQAEPCFELSLRSGHRLRFPEGASTGLVADLLRALEAP